MDTARLKEGFVRAAQHGEEVAQHGEEVALSICSGLFLRHPGTRDLFPTLMADQGGHLLQALAAIISDLDDTGQLAAVAQALDRDHRKYGTLAAHHEPGGSSLLATVLSHEMRTFDIAVFRGTLADVMARPASWAHHDACRSNAHGGSDERQPLLAWHPVTQVHVEDFGWSEPCP